MDTDSGRKRPGVKGEDFAAPSGFEDEIEKGGQKTKYRKNVAAVSLLKVLEAENRAATPVEKEICLRARESARQPDLADVAIPQGTTLIEHLTKG